MVTSLSERDHRVRGIQSGADDFLTKPVDIDEVLLRVRNAVIAKQVMDELQLRRGEETLDDVLLRQLGNVSATNPRLALSMLTIGAKMLALRTAAGRLDDEECSRMQAVVEQIGMALRKSGARQNTESRDPSSQ